MKKILFLLVLIFLIPQLVFSATTKQDVLTPLFIGTSETDTIFRNPAELPLYENLLGGRLTYGLNDKRFTGSFIFHLPDFSLGDLALSVDGFGSDFSQNVVWIDSANGGSFSLTEGGYKGLITWAKKTDFLTVGINGKWYRYGDKKTAGEERQAVGMDLGFFFTPFEDLFIGAVANDFGDTIIRDLNQNEVERVKQEIRLSAAVLSGDDMAFSIGVPFSRLWEAQDDPNNFWKRMSFQGRKIFGNWLVVGAGYNTKDIYYDCGFKLNDFFKISLIGSNDVINRTENEVVFVPDKFTISFSYGLPFETVKEIQKNVTLDNPWIEYPMMLWGVSVDGPSYYSRARWRKEDKLKRKMRKMEDKIDDLEEEMEDQKEKEKLEAEITDLEDSITRKTRRLKRLSKRFEKLKNEASDESFDLEDEIGDLRKEIRKDRAKLRKKKKELRKIGDPLTP
ncbi:hypothetical protein ACFL2K_00085 [Candidatus Margulisiibacteriota bacterium]